ncbi:MAG: MFS transporter [Pseudomonadales bacterium]|jgi:MFS family permease|nr:MFS transporter [Pseudomonadales bacterium]
MFASLAHRDYRYLWAANLAATFAMQMSQVARGWLVYAMTGSPVKLAWVMLSFLAPTIVFSLVGGVLADRVPKKRIMVLAQLVNCASTFALAAIVYTGAIEFWHFIAFGVLNGTVLSLSMPARQAIIPEIVGERGIFNAIALSSASMNLSRVLGPTAAGATIAWVAGGDTGSTTGVGIVFFVIASLYGLSSLSTAFLRTSGVSPPRRRGTAFEELFSGVRHIAATPLLRALFLLAFVATLFGMPVQFLMPAFNEDALGGGPDDLGLLMGAMGVGAVAGSLILARMGETGGKGWFMILAALAWAAANAWLAAADDVEAALPLAAVGGFFSSSFMSLNNSLIQLSVANEMRGRVMSAVMMMWGLMPIGVVPISFLAEALGIARALEASAVVLVLIVVAAALVLPELRRIDRGYEDEADPAPVGDVTASMVKRGEID